MYSFTILTSVFLQLRQLTPCLHSAEVRASTKNSVQCYQTDFSSDFFPARHETRPTMTSIVMVLNLFLNLLQICILQAHKTTQTQWQCDGQEGSIPVWRWHPHNGAAWEQPCFPSILPRYLMAMIFTAFDLAAYI